MSDSATETIWCEKHGSSATGQTERCLSALNAALRMGVNPFDPYNSRKFGGKCKLVERRLADPDALIVEKVDGEWPAWAKVSLTDPPLYELSPAAQRDLGMDGEAVKVKPHFILDGLAAASGEDVGEGTEQ